MEIEGVDYAWARPDPERLYAVGKRFACRYLSYNTGGKNLTAAERDALWAAGLAICLNWENRADDHTDGFTGGAKNARTALAQARALGFPDELPIYFSIDTNTNGGPSVIDAYLKGVASVLPVARIGVYGGYSTVKRAREAGLAAWLWQTYAWSNGRWYPGVHLQQYDNGVTVAGGDCDLNRAMVADYGQWTSGDDMPTAQREYLDRVQDYRLDAINQLRVAVVFPPFTASDGTKFPGFTEPCQLGLWAATQTKSDAEVKALVQQTLQAASDDPDVQVTLTPEQIAAMSAAVVNGVTTAIDVPTADEIADEVAQREADAARAEAAALEASK